RSGSFRLVGHIAALITVASYAGGVASRTAAIVWPFDRPTEFQCKAFRAGRRTIDPNDDSAVIRILDQLRISAPGNIANAEVDRKVWHPGCTLESLPFGALPGSVAQYGVIAANFQIGNPKNHHLDQALSFTGVSIAVERGAQ